MGMLCPVCDKEISFNDITEHINKKHKGNKRALREAEIIAKRWGW